MNQILTIQVSSQSRAKNDTLSSTTQIQNNIHRRGEKRLLQPRSNVRLINNCGFDASVGIIYLSKALKAVYLWLTIKKGRGIMLRSVSDPTIFIYGYNSVFPDDLVWVTANSKYCVSEGHCFEPRIVGSLANSLLRYKLCGTTVPTPSPIAKAPPTLLDYSYMSEIEIAWLNAHNRRRNEYYNRNGVGSADLKWSKTLQKSAQNYSSLLISIGGDSKCTIRHGVHGNTYGGENLSKNWGTSSKTNSSTPEEILTSWFDEEIDLPYGENFHATQVVFRSSRYVGCGTSEKTMYHGGKCFINVCRYLSPGNCNMSPQNWKARTLDNNTFCLPFCPEEGCF
jgi:hypothetical protein